MRVLNTATSKAGASFTTSAPPFPEGEKISPEPQGADEPRGETKGSRGMPTTLSELVTQSAAWDAEFSEIPVNAEELNFDDGAVRYDGQLMSMDQACRTLLFNKIHAPGTYFEKHSPSLQATALAAHRDMGDFGAKPTLVLRGSKLVTISRGELLSLPNSAVIRAVEEELGIESEGLSIARIVNDEELVDVELVSPTKATLVRKGDVVQSGLHIVHHRFGSQATLIEAFVYRLVCSNGMTRRECVGDGLQRTRKLPLNFPNNRNLQLGQIRRLTRQTWNGLQAQLDALRATTDRPADVEQLLSRWLQRARISMTAMRDRLMAAWREEGAENTHYGAVNALTRVATHHHDLSQRQRRVFASLAGLLAFSEVHICPRCLSVLAGTAAHSDLVD
jgi:hypothetical protein